MAEPASRLAAPCPPTGVDALRARMRELAGLLLDRPRAEKAELLPLVRALCRTLRGLELGHGLPHLVLRNLLADLRARGPLDAPYHAEQLERAADRLDAGEPPARA